MAPNPRKKRKIETPEASPNFVQDLKNGRYSDGILKAIIRERNETLGVVKFIK